MPYYDDYEDDANNWSDLKFNGPRSEEYDDLEVVEDTGSLYDGSVDYIRDPVDYARFTLETAATVCFSVCSSDASVKFAVYRVTDSVKKGVQTYSLKTLASATTKKSKDEDDDDYYGKTKKMLLAAGDYYISVSALNKKGVEARYDVEIDDEKSNFFNEGDNSDDWTDLKVKGDDGEVGDIGRINVESEGVLFDDWVGYGDVVDYKRFRLDTAARVSFYVDATDKAKFTVYRLITKTDKKGAVTYSLKSLQSTTLSKIKGVDEDEEYKYEKTSKGLLLEAGEYYIGVESKNAKSGGSAYYDVMFERGESTFFVDGDNGWNDWLYDKKAKVLNVDNMDQFVVTELNNLTTDVMVDNSGPSVEYWNNYVGYGDTTDFARIHLDSTAKVSFILEASDNAKFTIYSLTEVTKKGVKTPNLKALQTTVVKKSKGAGMGMALTKGIQLAAGDYYISMQATNASKGGTAYYNVTLNKRDCAGLPVIEVYDVNEDADDGWNDWLCNRKKGLNPDEPEFLLNPLKVGSTTVLLDDNPISVEAWDNYVGYGDDTDFAKVTLESAAKLSFTVNATDAVKVILYSLDVSTDGKGETTYTQNAIQTTILKKEKGAAEYAGTTDALLLEKGGYYISVQSTNASKGGSAYYNVRMVDDAIFYTAGNNADDWTDLKTKGELGQVGNVGVVGSTSGVILEDWVGFGDAADYKRFTLNSAARISFSVSASAETVFTVWQLVENERGGDIVYSLESLRTVTPVKPKNGTEYAGSTESILLEAGDYYFSMESPDAASGGSADYRVSLNAGASTFFVDGDNSDDWTELRTDGPDGDVGDAGVVGPATTLVVSNWVGYGDEIDYKLFTLETAAKLSFTVTSTDAAVFSVYRLNEYEERGETVYSLTELQTVSLSAPKTGEATVNTKSLLLDAGDYYFSMKGVNAASGGSASYTVSVNPAGSEFFVDGDNLDDWTNLETEGKDGAVGDAGTVDPETTLVFESWVGYGDAVDYAGFTLETAAKLSFTVTATDTVKFTVCQIVESWRDEEPVYSLQSLQTVTVQVASGAAEQTAATPALLLDEGTYYFCVESVNAASGRGGYYTINVNVPSSIFYIDVDNSDDWTDLETEGADGEVGEIGTIDQESTLVMDNWVGYGDAVDYAGFTIDNAAKLRFTLTVTDSLTFSIYRLVGNEIAEETVFSLEALQSTAVVKPAGVAEYTLTTGFLLLDAGDYYIGVESANAAEGGNAYYTVTFDGENSVFYTEGDNSDDWTDLAVNGASGEVSYIGSLDQSSTVLQEDWVGFGDEVDYAGFSIHADAGLCFTITATDAAEFTICRLVATTVEDVTTYSLETLQTTVLVKAGDATNYSATTQLLQLTEGDYYFGMRSTNAAEGGSAYYTVTLNTAACTNLPEPEIIEYPVNPSADDGWNNWLYDTKTATLNPKADDLLRTDITSASTGILLDDNPIDREGWSNFVGYADEADYAKIRLAADARLSFNLSATDAAEFTIYNLKEESGVYSLTAYQTTVLALNELDGTYSATSTALLLTAGDYYISMQSLNASTGGGAYYNVALNLDGSEFNPVSVQNASALAGPETPADSALDDSLVRQTAAALA